MTFSRLREATCHNLLLAGHVTFEITRRTAERCAQCIRGSQARPFHRYIKLPRLRGYYRVADTTQNQPFDSETNWVDAEGCDSWRFFRSIFVCFSFLVDIYSLFVYFFDRAPYEYVHADIFSSKTSSWPINHIPLHCKFTRGERPNIFHCSLIIAIDRDSVCSTSSSLNQMVDVELYRLSNASKRDARAPCLKNQIEEAHVSSRRKKVTHETM